MVVSTIKKCMHQIFSSSDDPVFSWCKIPGLKMETAILASGCTNNAPAQIKE